MWADADENARIMESVKNETEAENKDLSPDGLAYHVSNMELEVERYATLPHLEPTLHSHAAYIGCTLQRVWLRMQLRDMRAPRSS
jgi:hypothetical protein